MGFEVEPRLLWISHTRSSSGGGQNCVEKQQTRESHIRLIEIYRCDFVSLSLLVACDKGRNITRYSTFFTPLPSLRTLGKLYTRALFPLCLYTRYAHLDVAISSSIFKPRATGAHTQQERE